MANLKELGERIRQRALIQIEGGMADNVHNVCAVVDEVINEAIEEDEKIARLADEKIARLADEKIARLADEVIARLADEVIARVETHVANGLIKCTVTV